MRSFCYSSCFLFFATKTVRPAPFYRSHVRSFVTSRIRRLDMETVHTAERLHQLRDLMKQAKVDVYGNLSDDLLNLSPESYGNGSRAFRG